MFTKRYAKGDTDGSGGVDPEQLADQRKLVFGMLFSLREIAAALSPDKSKDTSLHSVKTGASTCYCYESASGLRFALFTDNNDNNNINSSGSSSVDGSIQKVLQRVYSELWIQCVTRSPLYRPTNPNVEATNFESKLDTLLQSQMWFR